MIIYFFLKLGTTLSLIQDVFSVLRDPKDLSRHIDVQYYLSGDDLSGIQKKKFDQCGIHRLWSRSSSCQRVIFCSTYCHSSKTDHFLVDGSVIYPQKGIFVVTLLSLVGISQCPLYECAMQNGILNHFLR